MFCSSLRTRPEWTPAISFLTSSAPRLQESRLNTHDIALSLAQQGRFFRLVLLSPKDVGTPATEQRLERLYNLNGGCDAAVLFLLDQQGHDANPMEAFMNLQIEILNKIDLPLLPLSSIPALPSILASLWSSLATEHQAVSWFQANSLTLLQHMASGRDPLSGRMTNLLSELGRSPREVAALAETEQGKARIMNLLDPADGARVLSFLAQEKLIFA